VSLGDGELSTEKRSVMGQAVGQMFSLAIGMAISPVAFSGVVLVPLTPLPRAQPIASAAVSAGERRPS